MASPIASSATKAPDSTSSNTNSLLEKLAAVLPAGYRFCVYHLSTPPSRTEPLCSAPPGERPDKTYWETHFLAISVELPQARPSRHQHVEPPLGDGNAPGKEVFVLALEIFLFTTAYSTTLFVSKADSTGYLALLKLPKNTPSPIREISSTFIQHLLQHRRRDGIQFVISLFARSQNQYLFPLSVENKDKHVLDDRGLVKWWCRVLDPMLSRGGSQTWESVQGYLIVPGLERNEMRFFIPRHSGTEQSWILDHPLEKISHYTQEFDWVPPRCLIPRYPDDPKSRFRDELDEESAKYRQDIGSWKSIKSLAEFWEMMAFRQECSSGRLTGFIWVVFDPTSTEDPSQTTLRTASPPPNGVHQSASGSPDKSMHPPETPPRRRASILDVSPVKPIPMMSGVAGSSPTKLTTVQAQEQKQPKKRKKLTGPIIPRVPRVKKESNFGKLPVTTPFYHWPVEGRGEVIVDESDYKRIVELLLHLDFKNLEKASLSTARWTSQASRDKSWGQQVIGKRPLSEESSTAKATEKAVTNLTGLVRKRARPTEGTDSQSSLGSAASMDKAPVNVLGAGLIRKKRKEPDNKTLEA